LRFLHSLYSFFGHFRYLWACFSLSRGFIFIAQCRDTITSALSRAAHPARVVVAAVEQNAVDGDEPGCTEPHKTCEEDPSQAICARGSQIRLFKVNSLDATGPVFARHVGDRM
jgi:hypothetical protein